MGESVLIVNSVIQLTIRTWTNLAWKTPESAIIRHVKSGSGTGLGKAGGVWRAREGGRETEAAHQRDVAGERQKASVHVAARPAGLRRAPRGGRPRAPSLSRDSRLSVPVPSDSMGNNAWAHSLDLPLGFLPLAQAMGAGV